MDFKTFAKLTRLEHALMLCAAVLIGEVIVLRQMPTLSYALLTFFPPFFLEISAFAINDYLDIETDRANKRFDRPLVSGAANPGEALLIAVASLPIGIFAGWLINPMCFYISIIFGIVSLAYSYKLKDMPLMGNAYIALSMAIPFIFGNYAVSSVLNGTVLTVALIAFVIGLGREIIKSVEDMEGDRKVRGANTLPMVMGKQLSLFLASALLFIGVFLTVLPFISNSPFKNDMNYAVFITIADMLLLYVAMKVAFQSDADTLSHAKRITIAALGIGLIGFFVGALL